MSDTFDHYGDAWDSYERSFDGGDMYDPFRCRRSRSYHDPWCVTCKKCGTTKLKWRTDDAGRGQLYENERIEHNRLKPHVCPQDQPSPEGFDNVD